ncbi:hypothetical protein H4684_003702 [Desulfomicrobium macestii]|uniref:Uncharacterized protein n=1 Tax=Desulfomicrobium macestii TaxID=90731 RepID=A0ABR9H8Z6_9BACT|nr:hypothetical protein [Desulfomicrobium macestii]MBE1427018.1 hypothetical protein [Desulfomicrobium macestii]
MENNQIFEAIQGLFLRPEWTERAMDPERAKIDLVLYVANGGNVTIAGMARRWGMPRTSARRVIQTAAALVPWLDACVTSPKNDHTPIHDTDHVDTCTDTKKDCPADARKQDSANAQSDFMDSMMDVQSDCPSDSPEAGPENDQPGERGDGGDIEALETLLDSMATTESVVDPEEITIEGRAMALARRAWEIMPDNVKARVDHDFDAYWQQSKSQHIRAAANA